MVVLAGSATWGMTHGLGPWSRFTNPVGTLILPQAFMVTMAVMTLAMAAVVWERKRAEAEANEGVTPSGRCETHLKLMPGCLLGLAQRAL